MMKSNRITIVLFVLFFASLLAMWGADVIGLRRNSEVRRRSGRVLPDLIDVPEAAIDRVAIDRGQEHLVFERRGERTGRWQMVQPKDVAAEPARLEALVRNLKELRPLPDAGNVQGDPSTYGLATPVATVRLYAGAGAAGGSASSEQPVAELELGKAESSRGLRYVRPAGGAGIQVVDSRLLAMVNQPVAEWREPNVMPVPSFQIAAVTITRRDGSGQSPKVIRAERGRSGRWRITSPIEAPGNGPKIESLLGALSSLRVAEPPKGFVADDVKDPARFGLDKPSITAELKLQSDGSSVVLDVGKPVPDEPERVYVRQGGQDDVVAVDARPLSEVPVERQGPAQPGRGRDRAGRRRPDRDPDRPRRLQDRAGSRRLAARLAAQGAGRHPGRPGVRRPDRRPPDQRVPRSQDRPRRRCSTRR